jgi:hypothetical protein
MFTPVSPLTQYAESKQRFYFGVTRISEGQHVSTSEPLTSVMMMLETQCMEKQRLCPMPRVLMGKISEITTVGTGPNPVAKAQAKSDVLYRKMKKQFSCGECFSLRVS